MSETSDEFCNAINQGDTIAAMETLVSVVSRNESMHTDTDPNFGNALNCLMDWLKQCDCIEEVELSGDILKAQPPLRVITLTMKPQAGGRAFHLKLRLGSRMEVHSFER